MKRWGKHFYFLLAVFWILGLSGCGESITVAIDGAEVQTTEVELSLIHISEPTRH